MKRAFSVIEVLVSLAIICVLYAILMPVLVTAKEKAKETVCVSNLRQLGLALELYHNDNGEYPTPWDPIDPYMSGGKLKCPVDKGPGYNFASYLNSANVRKNQNAFNFPDLYEKFIDCREKRGPEYPLILDLNHLPKILHEDDILPGFALAYRTSGAVKRISKKTVVHILNEKLNFTPKPDTPCDVRLSYANL